MLETNPWGSYGLAYNVVKNIRQEQYQKISDPIFFEYQRGEATKQQWLDAVQAINDANPYPEES
jgi:hypothetical protein